MGLVRPGAPWHGMSRLMGGLRIPTHTVKESDDSCSFARCAAPSTYSGYCDKVQTFIGSSGASTIPQNSSEFGRVCRWCLLQVAAKMELETSCEICWRWSVQHAIFDLVVYLVWKEALLKGRGGRSGNLRSRLGTTMPSWRGALCNVVGWSMCAFVEATFLKTFHTMNFGRRLASHAQRICLTRARCVVHCATLIR